MNFLFEISAHFMWKAVHLLYVCFSCSPLSWPYIYLLFRRCADQGAIIIVQMSDDSTYKFYISLIIFTFHRTSALALTITLTPKFNPHPDTGLNHKTIKPSEG